MSASFHPLRAATILSRTAEAHPELPCLDFLGAKMTYAEVLDTARRAARGLQDLGVRKGDRVGLCLPNSPYYVIGYFATLMIGATVVNFNPLYTEDELRHQIEDSDITVMFTLDLKKLYAKVANALHKTSLRTLVVCSLADALPTVKGWLMQAFKRGQTAAVRADLAHVPFDLLIADKDAPEPVEIDPERDIAVLQYTGGTTGAPKGAMLTHANITANTQQVSAWLGDVEPGCERVLCVIPFFHVFAMTVAMNLGLSTGAQLILLPRFDLKQVLQTIHEAKPTLFPAVPTLYGAINNAPDVTHYDLTSLRYCISGGAALPVKVKAAFESLSGCVVVEGYGLSETSPVVTCNPPHGENKPGSIGLPLPWTEVKLRDLEGGARAVPPGEHGELVVRGPQVMAGYWKRENETRAVLSDGWLRTGDVGYRDAGGYLFLTDRLKDIIICSGFNVYPRTIEDVLYRHHGVREAIVIGIPDEYRGEAPKAFVTLKADAQATPEELLAFTHEKLNPIERPVAVEIRDKLPKTLIGKLSKKELVAQSLKRHESVWNQEYHRRDKNHD